MPFIYLLGVSPLLLLLPIPCHYPILTSYNFPFPSHATNKFAFHLPNVISEAISHILVFNFTPMSMPPPSFCATYAFTQSTPMVTSCIFLIPHITTTRHPFHLLPSYEATISSSSSDSFMPLSSSTLFPCYRMMLLVKELQ